MKKNWSNKNIRWLLLALPLLLAAAGCKKADSHQHADGEVYTCPMHPQVVQDSPGTCPICKMDLVKREAATGTAKADPGDHQHAEGSVYTCPMHPEVKRDAPGSCPVCGMDLVKKGGAAGTDSVAADLDDLLKPVNAAVVSSIRTVHPVRGTKEIPLELPGTVEYDTRRIQTVSSRFAGRIEELYVRYNYQPVRKGQKLLEVYSPQIVEAQQELIFLLTRDAGNRDLIEAAKRKLSLLGLSPAQINAVAATRKPLYKVAVYSPYNGYVVENLPPAPSSPGGAATETGPAPGGMSSGGGMGGMNAGGVAPGPPAPVASPAGSSFSVAEGAYVSAGRPIFRVVNTDRVWGVFQTFAGDAARVEKGHSLVITPENDTARAIRGTVDLVEPFYRNGRNTATLRVHLANPQGVLRSGMLLTGRLVVKTEPGLWLPREAVLDLGNRRVAFVREGTTLRPVALRTGLQTGDSVEVLDGLTAEDAVAENARFLVDTEAFVRLGE